MTRRSTIVFGALLAGTLASLAFSGPAPAQSMGYTPGPWNRVETEHFEFLYPDELEGWALSMAERMESVHETVGAMVGYAPDRVTVVVDDPGNVSNGSMNPGPLLYVWPTPPNPRSMIGENRGWAEILAVHEFAHAAHLTRPSRNARVRFFSALFPVPVTNLMRVTPRWVSEGYATYVEGRLTGSGRPHGLWRPAVLRTWALEGQLPTYGAVSGTSGYYGGAMAYLVGSAYLEWLVEREGGDESVLPNLWARLTAREQRSFTGAFSGVFGAPPGELYGRFTVDVTERALAVRDTVEAAGGVANGELFQRYSWTTGDPAVAPDGERLVLRRTSEDGPSRLVVINATPDTLTTEQREAYDEIFEDDPEDVEPVQRRPRAQRSRATLYPVNGLGYAYPAWMPDGQGILVTRSDVVANGRTRPDLFLWNWDDGGVRRITHGQAIRMAAPAPDGSWAVGLRCLHARCDIVRIELDDGIVTTLAEADIDRPFYHPRVSPDGGTIVASVQDPDGWRLVAMDADGGNLRTLDLGDGASRFDAEFLPDGRLVVTSTRSGIHNLEILDPATGRAETVTRVLGAAVAPAPAPDGSLFFLSLHSRGWDLRRIDPEPLSVVDTDPGAFPSATIPLSEGETFEAESLADADPYGLGPRFRIALPMVHASEDGLGGGLAIGGTDPIGRLGWQLQGTYGNDEAPVGGALRLRYRPFKPWLHLEGFWTRNELPESTLPPGATPEGPQPGDDEAFYGAFGAVELQKAGTRVGHTLRAGGAYGRLADAGADRVLGFGEYRLRLEQSRGEISLAQWVTAHGALGSTGSLDWNRWLAHGGFSVRGDALGIGLMGTIGGTDAPVTSMEAFSLGGADPLLFDEAVTSQRVAMPALTTGALRGDRVNTVRGELYGALPVTSFVWLGRTVEGGSWTRLYGIYLDESVAEIPYIRLPATRIQMGLARIQNGPAEGEWRGWLMLGYQP